MVGLRLTTQDFWWSRSADVWNRWQRKAIIQKQIHASVISHMPLFIHNRGRNSHIHLESDCGLAGYAGGRRKSGLADSTSTLNGFSACHMDPKDPHPLPPPLPHKREKSWSPGDCPVWRLRVSRSAPSTAQQTQPYDQLFVLCLNAKQLWRTLWADAPCH